MENALTQIFISLLFFYQETGYYHNDAHWGNFLYHKIKKGGYFHYKINGKSYYIENIGYLWVIWDFGLAKLINSRFDIRTDYHRIMGAFINRDIKKILDIDGFDEEFNDKIDKLALVVNVKENYTKSIFNNYVNTILYYLINLNLIKTKNEIKKNDIIINNKPYIYNNDINA
jgi:predicted unusual protein kinase regulating ubiquinone biosynthesis (AarF/ABC1/UbiB family)